MTDVRGGRKQGHGMVSEALVMQTMVKASMIRESWVETLNK